MELEAAKILVQYQRNLYSCLVWDEPENVVWTNMVMPTELFYACGLIPLHAEMTAGWISSLHLAEELIREAEQRGIRGGLCSYHRAVIGALERGELPPAPPCGFFLSYLRWRQRPAALFSAAVSYKDFFAGGTLSTAVAGSGGGDGGTALPSDGIP